MTGKKTGGRLKGTPNKRTCEFLEKLEALNFDPVEKLIAIQADKDCSMELRVKVLMELLQYAYPKRKTIEYGEAAPAAKGGTTFA